VDFFKKAWSIVSLDTINTIWSFFISVQLLKQVNATTITLVPKVPNPSMIEDFRAYLMLQYHLHEIGPKVLPDLIGPF